MAEHLPSTQETTSGSVFLGTNSPASNSISDIPALPSNSNARTETSSSQTEDNNTVHQDNDSVDKIEQQLSDLDVNADNENYTPLIASGPQFRSALSYTEVRDYAYPDFHPLHYGVPIEELQGSDDDDEFSDDGLDDDQLHGDAYPDSYMRDGGPPWKEDSDLASPVVISHSVGDRISKEYEFSVASADEIHGRAIALFDFIPENDNEVPLREGQTVWVSYRHGQGWLVAEDRVTGETGLVPEEYVQMITGHDYSNSQSSTVDDRQSEINGHYEEDLDEAQWQEYSGDTSIDTQRIDNEGWVDEGPVDLDSQDSHKSQQSGPKEQQSKNETSVTSSIDFEKQETSETTNSSSIPAQVNPTKWS